MDATWIRRIGLALVGVEVERGVLPDRHLGHGVGEVRFTGRAEKRLRDPRLAVGARHDQRPRMRHRPARAAVDHDDVNRIGDA